MATISEGVKSLRKVFSASSPRATASMSINAHRYVRNRAKRLAGFQPSLTRDELAVRRDDNRMQQPHGLNACGKLVDVA